MRPSWDSCGVMQADVAPIKSPATSVLPQGFGLPAKLHHPKRTSGSTIVHSLDSAIHEQNPNSSRRLAKLDLSTV
jgi:hypothetical protein